MKYTAEMNAEKLGQSMQITSSGDTLQVDREHLRTKLEMNVKMATLPDGMMVTLLIVADGVDLWLEMDQPLLGGKHVLKAPIDEVQELAATHPQLAQVQEADPLAQIRTMGSTFDFSLAGISEGRVTLTAELDRKQLLAIGAELPDELEGLGTLVLVLDEKMALPVEMTLGAEPSIMKMRFVEIAFVDPATLGGEAFRYLPPEGAAVQDLGSPAESAPGATPPEDGRTQAP
jgi:hypothetical protein